MTAAVPTRAQGQARVEAPRPIDAGMSLWAEELTWMEIRDLVKAGTTTIIIGTGGVEQNGPYVAGGKHNFVLQTVLPSIARAIPNSLIAPIVKSVPEGRIEPATSGHMNYPGTISLEAATFEADTRNGMHDDIYYESQIAVVDPALIRAEQRRTAGLLILHGVDESDVKRLAETGRKLAEYRAGITAQAFKASQ